MQAACNSVLLLKVTAFLKEVVYALKNTFLIEVIRWFLDKKLSEDHQSLNTEILRLLRLEV